MLYRKGSMMDYEGEKLDYLIVNSKEEQKKAKGWVEHPSKAAKKSKITLWFKTTLKPWWNEWEWLFKLIAVVLAIAAAAIGFFA